MIDREVIDKFLMLMYFNIGIVRPENHESIIDFIISDVEECADPNDWTDEDVRIAFRRFLESNG